MKFQVIQSDAAQMPITSQSIDLTVTSPPYDGLRTYNGFTFDFEAIANELFRVTKIGGVVVWVVGDATVNGSETGTSFRQALYFKEIGFNLHDTMIYEKAGFPFPDSNRYNPVFEFMFIFAKGKIKTINLITDKANKYAGDKVARLHSDRQRTGAVTENSAWRNDRNKPVKELGVRNNIWKYAIGKGNVTSDFYAFQHPAMFPEALARDHILSWSNEGDTVLDCFCGSGTTGKMAMITKRNFIGLEISKEYCELSKARITRATGKYAEIPKRKSDKDLPLFAPEKILLKM